MSNLGHLFKTRRFTPLLVTQFFGAFNDNLFKNALIVMVVFGTTMQIGIDSSILVTVISALFILPYVLFSATAGQLADKIEQSRLARATKWCELALMILAAFGFASSNIWLLMLALFGVGVQATFFSPVKYSLVPQHLHEDEVLGGNSLLEAFTFLAILAGTITGNLMMNGDWGITFVSSTLIAFSVVGLIGSYYIPVAGPHAPNMQINRNIIAETKHLIKYSFEKRTTTLAILGISWFWLVGTVLFSQFPAFTKDVLRGDESIITILLTAFSIGIALGSLIAHHITKGEVTPKYVPLGILGMTIFMFDLCAASYGLNRLQVMTAGTFLSDFTNIRILFDLMMIAICGGIYIVPLNAILQTATSAEARASMIAANNVVNALFMVAASIVVAIMLLAGLSIPTIFFILAILNAGVALYICKILPDTLIKALVKNILSMLFRVEVKGMDNFHAAGNRVVIVANHLAYIDPLFVAAYLPERITYAVNTHTARAWWMKPVLALIDYVLVDATNPMATKSLIKEVQKDKKIVIYPEGRITQTGALMKVYEGPAMIADKADAMLLPIRLDGMQYTPFSKLQGKVRLRWFPKVTITIEAPQKINVCESLRGKERRRIIGLQLYNIMSDLIYKTSDCNKTLWQSVCDAKALHGGRHFIAEDIQRNPINYSTLIKRSLILGKYVEDITKCGEYVGLMLPNTCASLTAFLSLQAYGRVPAMLNYSVGAKSLISACHTATLKSIITSRAFIERGNLQHLTAALEQQGIALYYLEDMKENITLYQKLYGLLRSIIAPNPYKHNISPHDPAVILFTSGSEGTPKGVVLSHQNLQANRFQLASRIDFTPVDTVFNAMPIFHSFGLGAATILPLLSGIKIFFYPSPLHYRIVPELIYDTNATIMFGTDTFLNGYAKFANAYDFYSLRYIFAGAEKLREETRRIYADRYGIRVLEGYGATETSPVLSINTPMHNRTGTVGRLLPGIEHTLEEVEGITYGGRLHVKGKNVMIGYLRAENAGILEPTNGTYDTGDIVDIDTEGYITIRGRAKRFAKIGGEMISLTAIEQFLSAYWPEKLHAVIAVPDDKKGEALMVITECRDLDRTNLAAQAKSAGLADISIPKQIRYVDAIPILGTGKIDYQSLLNESS
jgi:acyl-[acyl-carrier-protein]-phospholipid O-acyltransferase/long-chain-fatty-acid--[acyl-carrier-protein] ligase